MEAGTRSLPLPLITEAFVVAELKALAIVHGLVRNQAAGEAELDVVRVMAPGKVFREGVDRNGTREGGVGSDDRVDVPEGDVVRSENAGGLATLPRESVAEGADQVRTQHRGQARGHPFVVGESGGIRRLSRELRRAGGVIVLQVAAPEERVLAAVVQLVVQLGGIGVLLAVDGRVERVAGEVQCRRRGSCCCRPGTFAGRRARPGSRRCREDRRWP